MKIKIKGVVIPNDYKWLYDWFEIDSISPGEVEAQLEAANGEDLGVEINSPGGDVYSGSEIYTALKAYSGRVRVNIVGIAASAASVIAMAGDHVAISPTAQIMIHNVSGMAWGDYRAMDHESQVLKDYNVSIANAYTLKTSLEQKELLGLMNKETWLNAQQALEKGFVDEIMFDEGKKLAAAANAYMLPPEVINKLRSVLKKDNNPYPPAPEPNLELVDIYQKQILINRRKANVRKLT